MMTMTMEAAAAGNDDNDNIDNIDNMFQKNYCFIACFFSL